MARRTVSTRSSRLRLDAALLLELVFLQAGEDDLGQMAVAVVLGGRDRDGVLQTAFLEVLGHLRRVQLRLLARLRKRVDALDRHAERDHRHDDQDDADALGHPPHLVPHLNQIHSPLLRNLEPGNLSQRIREKRHCSVKFTVTVMMTGTGTPLSSVGVNCHCLTASSAAWSSSGIERRTFASLTRPSAPMVASMMTMPGHARRLRDRRVDRLDVLGLGRRLDVRRRRGPGRPAAAAAAAAGPSAARRRRRRCCLRACPLRRRPVTPTPTGAGASGTISFGASTGAALGFETGWRRTLGGARGRGRAAAVVAAAAAAPRRTPSSSAASAARRRHQGNDDDRPRRARRAPEWKAVPCTTSAIRA